MLMMMMLMMMLKFPLLQSDTDMSTVCEDGHISDSSVAPSVKLESKRYNLQTMISHFSQCC